MKRIIALLISVVLIALALPFTSSAVEAVSVTYSVHTSYIGWMNEVSDGAIAAAKDIDSHNIEALKISVNKANGVEAVYSVHVANIGWMTEVSDGEMAGTTGLSYQMEAVKISLKGENADNYSVLYRAYVEGQGWQDWTQNGGVAGTTGKSLAIKGLQIKILLNEEPDENPLNSSIGYSTHVSNIGWQNEVQNGATAGVENKEQIEAIKIKLHGYKNISVDYSVHVSNVGWVNEAHNGLVAGTTGQSKAVEAVKMSLSGEGSTKYDIWYRVYVKGKGYFGWALNGEKAGTEGYGEPIQAIQIKIADKGSFVGDSQLPFRKQIVTACSSHVSYVGWQGEVYNGETSGTVGEHSIEAVKLYVINSSAVINYSVDVENSGWTQSVPSGTSAGTTGKNLYIEGIKMTLSGREATGYSIWYRTYVKDKGWLDWAKNGEAAGTDGYNLPIQAIETRIVENDCTPPSAQSGAAYLRMFGVEYSSKTIGIDGLSTASQGGVSGTTGQGKILETFEASVIGNENIGVEYSANIGGKWTETSSSVLGVVGGKTSINALKISLTGTEASKYDVVYKVHCSNIGWIGYAKNGEAAGAVGYDGGIEAVQVKIVDKGSVSTALKTCYQKINASYSALDDAAGWIKATDGKSAGNEKGASIKGLIISADGISANNIIYSAHVSYVGWMDSVTGGMTAGTCNQNGIEAIKITLSDELLKNYSVYYRAYVNTVGWMGWTKNGEIAGSVGQSLGVNAVQIKIVENGMSAPTLSTSLYTPIKKKLFAIDAGHGFNDSGAIGLNGRWEAKDNEKYANELKRILLQQGQDVYMIDRSLTTHDRPYAANAVNADWFISLHRDSTNSGNSSGISIYTHNPSHTQQIYEPEKDYAPAEYSNKHSGDDAMTAAIVKYLRQVPNVGIKGVFYGSASAPTYEDYYINRCSNMPSCIVELGYVNNATDNLYFDTYYKQYAKAIAKGLMEAAGLTFNELIYTAS